MDAIKKILKSTYENGVFHTHVSLIKPKGKFQFSKQVHEEFWKHYCDLITENKNPPVGIAEKPQEILPVIVDVDLKIKDSDNLNLEDSLYTEEQVKTVVQVYQAVIKEIVDVVNEQELVCIVLEKKMYQTSKNDVVYFKNGFHLHFPYVFLDRKDQEVHLIPRVQDAIKSLKLFENLKIEDSGSVIDKNCCNVQWLLYGSKKSEEMEPYLATKAYDSELKKISVEKALKYYQIFDYKDKLIDMSGKITYYLPRILSIIPWNRPTKELKKGITSPLKEKLRKERTSASRQEDLGVEENLKVARRLIPMLADWRASEYNEWMRIGWVLYNISDGTEEGLELWQEFSSRCVDKYDENGCIYQWERMTKQDLTLGTLKYYAKTDNEAEYNKFISERTQKHIDASLEGSHNDVAKALYEQYGNEFRCAGITTRRWFHFRNHHWEDIEEGIYLREKISGKIIEKYNDRIKTLYDELTKAQNDKGREAMLNTKIKQVGKMINSLKSAPYKNNVMKECMEVFYDPKLRFKLDSNPYLIAFKNGVYDLKNNVFRAGIPEDYISKTMPIQYREFREDDEKVQDVLTFLEQVFPDKSVRQYFMDISSDIFVGGNHEKIVVFWTGEGDNGKSVTQSFFEKMMGELAIKLNTNIITGKKPSAGSTFAELARAGGGVRWAVMEEPDNDEAINVGIFKNLSGNDSFFARDLFERGKDTREIIPMFKLNFICNKLPRIKYADKAVWNRTRVIPFESTFAKDNVPEDYEEQLRQKRFPVDKQFSKKIPNLVEAFAWILLQHRIKIQNKPRIEPEKVRYATEVYKRQNDIYRQFIEESIIEDSKKTITLIELYNIFKDWFKDSLPGHTLPVKNEIEEYFTKVWGSPEAGKKWSGYRQRTIQDDLKNGDAFVFNENVEKQEEDEEVFVFED